MDKILRRDILSDMSDQEVMDKHKIPTYRRLRQLWMKAKGYNVRCN